MPRRKGCPPFSRFESADFADPRNQRNQRDGETSLSFPFGGDELGLLPVQTQKTLEIHRLFAFGALLDDFLPQITRPITWQSSY